MVLVFCTFLINVKDGHDFYIKLERDIILLQLKVWILILLFCILEDFCYNYAKFRR